jgi:hypothetical protein
MPQIKLETYEKEVFEIDLDIAKKFGKLVPVLGGMFQIKMRHLYLVLMITCT